MEQKKYSIGIDIGGTGVEYGIVSHDGEVLYSNNLTTANFPEPEQLVETIWKDETIQTHLPDILGVGVGAPNGNYFHGTIEFAPNLKWKGIVPLAQLFKDRFNLPIFLTNDANAAAIGERIFGAAKYLNDFVLITLGTGVGSGVVSNGQLIYGHDGFAGEYGHIRVIPNGRLCGCGRFGCLETYASSTGVVRSIKELDSEAKEKSPLLKMDHPSAKDVFDLADEGDLFASEIVDYTAFILGSALADFACFSSPKAYVLFGGIAQHSGDFFDKVKSHLEANVLKIYQNKIDVIQSQLHDQNAAVLGGASLVFSELHRV